MNALDFGGPKGAKKLSEELRRLADLSDSSVAILHSVHTDSNVSVEDWPEVNVRISYRLTQPFGISKLEE